MTFILQAFDLNCAELRYHIYQLHQGGPETEELEEEDLAAANHWILPSKDFDGVWESLIFDENIKEKVIQVVSAII